MTNATAFTDYMRVSLSNKNKLQLAAPAVETILLEDVLATLTSKTAIIKIDVESLECKVQITTIFSYVTSYYQIRPVTFCPGI